MAVETWAQTPVRAIFLILSNYCQQISTADNSGNFNYSQYNSYSVRMEGFQTTLLPRIVKGLGIGALTLIGVGGGIAYANYRSQKAGIDEVNNSF